MHTITVHLSLTLFCLYYILSPCCPATVAPPTQAIRDARSAADAVGARSAAAEQRALDAHDGLQRLTDRVNRTEPRVDDSLKELAYSVEGACVGCVRLFAFCH
jgi:hypothetical protein